MPHEGSMTEMTACTRWPFKSVFSTLGSTSEVHVLPFRRLMSHQANPQLSTREHPRMMDGTSRPTAKRQQLNPVSLPTADSAMLLHHSAKDIEGNVSLRVKQLSLNVYAAYGVCAPESFGNCASRKVKFVRLDLESQSGRGSDPESSLICVNELVVDKSE